MKIVNLYWVSGWTHGFPPPPKELPDSQFGKDWPVSGIISSERRRWQKLFLICSLFLQNQKVGNWFRVLAENYVSATEVQEQFFLKIPFYMLSNCGGFLKKIRSKILPNDIKTLNMIWRRKFSKGTTFDSEHRRYLAGVISIFDELYSISYFLVP